MNFRSVVSPVKWIATVGISVLFGFYIGRYPADFSLEQPGANGRERIVFRYAYQTPPESESEPSREDLAHLGLLIHQGWVVVDVLRTPQSVSASTVITLER